MSQQQSIPVAYQYKRMTNNMLLPIVMQIL